MVPSCTIFGTLYVWMGFEPAWCYHTEAMLIQVKEMLTGYNGKLLVEVVILACFHPPLTGCTVLHKLNEMIFGWV